MPLTEAEELELLELEREQAMSLPLGEATAIRERYPSEKFSAIAQPISQLAGMFAKRAPIAAGITGLATGGVEAARQGIAAYADEPGARDISIAERAKRIGTQAAIGAGGEGIARGIFAGAAKVGKATKPRAVATGAQLMKVSAGVSEPTGRAILSQPSRLGAAPSMEQAGEQYARAMEATGLSQGPEAAMQLMGKSALSQESAAGFAYDAIQKLNKGELTYQEALVARDQLKNILKMPKWQNPNVAQSERFLIQMQKQLDNYLEPYFQEAGESFAAARGGYREAAMAKEFEPWLPVNANRGASVLRGMVATGAAGVGAYGGGPEDVATGLGVAALMSPRMLGYGIRAGAAAAPVAREAAKVGTRLGSNYAISSTEELLRKKYQEQK